MKAASFLRLGVVAGVCLLGLVGIAGAVPTPPPSRPDATSSTPTPTLAPAVSSCLSHLLPPYPSLYASFACASYLDQHFQTSTISAVTTVTDTIPLGTFITYIDEFASDVSTVSELATSYVVAWLTLRTGTTTDYNLASETTTVRDYSTTTRRVTTTRLEEGKVETAFKTVGEEVVVEGTERYTATVTAPTETVYSNALPEQLSGRCSPEDASAACSAFLPLPIPTPFASTTYTYETLTQTIYESWSYSYLTNTISTIRVIGSWTTVTFNTLTTDLYCTTYTKTDPVTVPIVIGTVTNTLSLTRKMAGTTTLTTTVPTITLPHHSTSTQTETPTTTLPSACLNPPSSHHWTLTSGAITESEIPGIDSREACCAACFKTLGCASYAYAGEPDTRCWVRVVEKESRVDGWRGERCPGGVVEGSFWEFSEGSNGLGPCWGGWWPAGPSRLD